MLHKIAWFFLIKFYFSSIENTIGNKLIAQRLGDDIARKNRVNYRFVNIYIIDVTNRNLQAKTVNGSEEHS